MYWGVFKARTTHNVMIQKEHNGQGSLPKILDFGQVNEEVVRLLLPYLLHGVGGDGESAGVSPDYRTATHMILVQLCSIATLATDFLEGTACPSHVDVHPNQPGKSSKMQRCNVARGAEINAPFRKFSSKHPGINACPVSNAAPPSWQCGLYAANWFASLQNDRNF
jgi:hypothetical protein